MIGCEQFYYLPDIAKAKYIEFYGASVGKRYTKEYRFELFKLGDFYVEHTLHFGSYICSSYTSFEDGKRLEPYLEQIDISTLFV
jgi:hypothetical protein